MREICTCGSMSGGGKTELRPRLRHRRQSESCRQQRLPRPTGNRARRRLYPRTERRTAMSLRLSLGWHLSADATLVRVAHLSSKRIGRPFQDASRPLRASTHDEAKQATNRSESKGYRKAYKGECLLLARLIPDAK